VTDSGVNGSVDYLNLDNGVSVVNFAIGPGPKDLIDCVDQTATWFSKNVFDDLVYTDGLVDSDTEFGAVFSAGGGQVTMVVGCLDFGHPQAKFLWVWLVRTDDAEAEWPGIEELWQGVSP